MNKGLQLIFIFLIVFLTHSIMAQKTINTGQFEKDSSTIHNAEDSLLSRAVTREEHVELKEKFYDEAIKALDYRKTVIDSLLTIIGIMLALIGLVTVYNYITGRNVRAEMEKETLKVVEVKEEAIQILEEVKSKRNIINELVVNATALSTQSVFRAESEAKEEGIKGLKEVIERIQESDARSSIEEFEKLYIQLKLKSQPLSILPLSLLRDVGMNYIKVGEFNKALELSESALEIEPNDDEANLLAGIALMNQEKYKQSIEFLRRSIRINPRNAGALSVLAFVAQNLYDDTKNHEYVMEAGKAARQAIEFDPNYASAHTNLSWTLMSDYLITKDVSFLDQALDQVKLAIDIDPMDAQALSNWSGILIQKHLVSTNVQLLKAALKKSEESLVIAPYNVYSLSNYGLVISEMIVANVQIESAQIDLTIKRLEYAYFNLKKGIIAAGSLPYLYLMKFRTTKDSTLLSRAYNVCITLIKYKQDNSSHHYNLACVYALRSQKEEMLPALRRAIELDPSLKARAKIDEDFKAYWDDADFINLVGN